MDFYDELRGLVTALEQQHIEYAVCGGVALAFHGYPRFTKDIDVLVLPDQCRRVLEIAEQRGFLDPVGRIPFENCEVYRTSKIDGMNVLTLDLLLVNPTLEDVWNDRQVVPWQGISLQVVSAAGLAKMKRLAGREQDLLDIQMLESSDGRRQDAPTDKVD